MSTLDLCRTCLSASTDKDIRDLKVCENNKNETYVEVLMFCLDIEVVENSAISTKLCGKCYETILAYHKFKTLALRNDHYLRTLKQSTVKLEHITKQTNDETEISQNALNYDIKIELEPVLEIDDTSSGLEMYNIEVKIENFDPDSGYDIPLTTATEPVEVEKGKTSMNENEISVKGDPRNKKLMPPVTDTSDKQSTKDDHPVSGSSKLFNNTYIEPPEKKLKTFETLITEETERNLNKATNYDICDKDVTDGGISQKYIRQKPYACEVCDKKFIQKTDLEKHIRTHTGEKPYACKICGKKFTESGSLKNHIRLHTGEKPYACKVCDKEFSQQQGLRQHLRTHTGEKPYGCGMCDKKFTRKANLEIHNRTHTDEKPYACEICNKKFTQKVTLETHIRTHTGEKPFACETCDKTFSDRGRLKKHIRIHTDETPYACEICNKKFTLKRYLKIHIRTHTAEKPCTLVGYVTSLQ